MFEFEQYPDPSIDSTDFSYAYSSSISFVDATGAGSSAEAIAISNGEISISPLQIAFAPDATSSSAEAVAIASPAGVSTDAIAEAPVQTTTDDLNFSQEATSYSLNLTQEKQWNNVVSGGDGDDRLRGTDKNDLLRGGDGDDHLKGTDGKDWLMGENGTDQLMGGAHADVFVVGVATNDPLLADVIHDFDADEGDKIGLVEGLAVDSLVFEVFSDYATLVKLGANTYHSILAVVRGTVDGAGMTKLTHADFTTVPSDILALG